MLTTSAVLIALLVTPQAPEVGGLGPAEVDRLPTAVTRVDRVTGELVIELPAVEVPAQGMIRTAVHRVEVPFEVVLHRYRVEVANEAGELLPADRLHHFNLTDPDRRELFAPLPLHLLAASKETGLPTVPRFLLGMPSIVRGMKGCMQGF